MHNEKNNNFDDTLKDILTPFDHGKEEIINNNEIINNYKKANTQEKSLKKTIFPVWIEISIRIIAAISALFFLFLFGWNIASK
ncbi:MAG: hypothetical protein PVI26_00085 [Chitinispirillia bacterium]|jgi:hypothetical protein